MTPKSEALIEEAIEQVRRDLEEAKAEMKKIPGAGVEWAGDAPFFLIFSPEGDTNGNVGIDLDAPGWIEINKHLFRASGTWFLMHKETGKTVFAVIIHEGDKFWYTKRHTGNLMAGREVVSFGIGKKQSDDSIVNLWLLPNGMVCGGEDVDEIAARMI